jgi:hypothetical protein
MAALWVAPAAPSSAVAPVAGPLTCGNAALGGRHQRYPLGSATEDLGVSSSGIDPRPDGPRGPSAGPVGQVVRPAVRIGACLC